jgi:hypothetical protein
MEPHTDSGPPASVPLAPTRRKSARGRLIVAAAAIILVALVISAIGYTLVGGTGSTSSPATTTTSSLPPANLLTNGGFATGDLQGWQSIPPYIPTVESSVVANGSSYAVRFQTSTNQGNVSSPCLIQGIGCSALNTSTIYQSVSDVSVSNDTRFSLAVYPMFQYPSGFQISLEFTSTSAAVASGSSSSASSSTSGQNSAPDVVVFYLVLASSQQCSTYSRDLINSRPNAIAAVHCLSAQQGNWTSMSRDLASDLPPGVISSELNGSMLTVSISFAGANPTDAVYIDSLSLA